MGPSVPWLLIEEVAGGRLGPVELLAHDRLEPLAGTIKIVVLLQALPGVGKVRARRALEQVGGPESTRLGDLDSLRRDRLAHLLSAPGADTAGR